MVLAFTTKDKMEISDFNSPILVIDTETNSRVEETYFKALSYADVLVTAHLDGFAAEDVTKYGVTPIMFRGTIEDGLKEFKNCGIKRSLPIGANQGCSTGSCGV